MELLLVLRSDAMMDVTILSGIAQRVTMTGVHVSCCVVQSFGAKRLHVDKTITFVWNVVK